MEKVEKIVIATRNLAKKERFGGLFVGMIKDIFVLDDFGITEKPQEHGTTAEENAEIKARFYSQKLNLPVFSEDEALYVDFLPMERQPGVFVRRIESKDEADDNTLLNYWEGIIAGAPKEKRTGR
ncbi:MAG: non-canonical purine NTP pyrophosphatase [Candidatus Jorgensenbacteria bacterium]